MNAAKVYHLSENGLSPHRREGWGEQNSLAFEATCKLKAMNRAVFDRVKSRWEFYLLKHVLRAERKMIGSQIQQIKIKQRRGQKI